MSDNKIFQSIYAHGLMVDAANHIAELLIRNFLVWQKKPLPQSPFWRENITSQSAELKELTKRYVVEAAEIHGILSVFTPAVVIDYIKRNNCISLKIIKKETKQRIINDLFKSQVDYNKARATEYGLKLADLERLSDKSQYTGTIAFQSKANKMALL